MPKGAPVPVLRTVRTALRPVPSGTGISRREREAREGKQRFFRWTSNFKLHQTSDHDDNPQTERGHIVVVVFRGLYSCLLQSIVTLGRYRRGRDLLEYYS